MSFNAKSASRTKSKKVSRIKDAEANGAIRAYLEKCYFNDGSNTLLLADEDELEPLPEILTQQQINRRALKRWMMNRLDVIDRINLAIADVSKLVDEETGHLPSKWRTRFNSSTFNYEAYQHYTDGETPPIVLGAIVIPQELERLGVFTPSQGNVFLNLYLKVYRQDRVWHSSKQVPQLKVAKVALSREYDPLPLWVKEAIVKYAPDHAAIGGDRIGNIWRLIPCCKAWKWAPLPKRIAEKIGKQSPRLRMLAAIAWEAQRNRSRSEGEKFEFSPSEFWETLSSLDKAELAEQVRFSLNNRVWQDSRDRWCWEAFLANALKVPYDYLTIQGEGEINEWTISSTIAEYGDPKAACQALFGVAGKTTVKAFRVSTKNARSWARVLGEGNPDLTQKILLLSDDNAIAFEQEAVNFLLSLKPSVRLRMLTTKTFKYRGEVHSVTNAYIRDTGYLWEKIQQKPDLGRVRCWFALHQQLAAAYVRELPNEPLPVPSEWQPIDGVCAIDGSWEIRIPKDVNELKYAGQILHNCVGGYGDRIKRSQSLVFTVWEDNHVTHCVEMDNRGSVRQFSSYQNGSPDRKIEAEVCCMLRQAKLLR